jgi:tetratricopeptide (TPR) repeat protein/glycosyltransferase involved in cell wall biosynthesis
MVGGTCEETFMTGPTVRRLLSRVVGVNRSHYATRRAGDRARDAKRWSEAAAHYAEYLKKNPHDVPTRIQLGNCLKEAGQLAEALDNYKIAIELDDKHADGYLQIGHLLKILGRRDDAIQAYRKSFELDPRDYPAFAELLAMGAVPPADLADDAVGEEKAIMDVTPAVRRAGDRARDAKRWSEAAAHYVEYLKHNPSDVPIRIQLGNCLKEAGQLAEARDTYKIAIDLDDKNADGYLQIGHLFKLLGRNVDAIHAYRKSFELSPRDNPAFAELLAMGAVPQFDLSDDVIAGETATIYLDVTDLIDYLRVNVSLSGIQRVVSNLITHAPEFTASPGGTPVRPVIPDYSGSKVLSVELSLLEGLISLVTSGRSDRDALDRALQAVLGSRAIARLKFGDTLLIPGAFWIYQRYDLLNILRQSGVRVAVFIHDLIQVSNPEFVEPAATTVFRRSLVDVLCTASYVLTNSRFVADEIRRYLSERMNFQLPVKPVTLATELTNKKLNTADITHEFIELVKEDYVLCVGTIEIRKNHIYLIRVWERLLQRFPGPVPNLVFVGKWGWEIAELQKFLEGSDYLGGRLYIYNEIADDDLAFLYQNCLLTLYPSFAEGWGLPVGESLGYGKPCIASKVTAIPEVGGALCKYLDPFEVEDGYQVLSDVLKDRPALEAWTRRVQSEFRPKTWKDFTCELFAVAQRYSEDRTPDTIGNNCIIETSEIATFGNDPLAQLDSKNRKLITARMTRMSGWHGLEPWGCWAARRRATLRITTRMVPGTNALVYLHLRTPDHDESADCTIKVNSVTTFIDDLGSVPVWCTAPGQVGDCGIIDIELRSGKGFFHRNGSERYIGILGIAVAPADDAGAQFELLGRIVRGGVPSQSEATGHLKKNLRASLSCAISANE